MGYMQNTTFIHDWNGLNESKKMAIFQVTINPIIIFCVVVADVMQPVAFGSEEISSGPLS
jgi:hypothetical protein